MNTTRERAIQAQSPAETSHSIALQRRIINYLGMRQLSRPDSLQVDVIAGTAIVRGRAMNERDRFRICECCRHVAGIYAVIDRIEVVAIQPVGEPLVANGTS